MVMVLDVLAGIFLVLASVLFFLKSVDYLHQIREKAKENPTYSKSYGTSIITGITSGIIVIILDRGLSIIMNTNSQVKLFGLTFQNLMANLLLVLLSSLFGMTLITLLIVFTFRKGLPE